jgi:hypothetical protein
MAIDTCHWHPGRETGLHCGNCGKEICVECMRHHPVGVRCKECANLNRLPTYQVSTRHVARGVGAAIGLGLAGAVGLMIVLARFPFAGFFFIVMDGLGYLIGEGVGKAVNQRRGRPYQYMALGSVLLATVPVFIESVFVTLISSMIILGGVGIAAKIAWDRRET